MAQALSNAAGHAYSRPGATEKHSEEPEINVGKSKVLSPVAPSRVGKKPITGFFEPEVSRQIKKVALDQDKTMQDLLQEALNDLFRKHDLPPIA
jgi:hypothetical protein